MIRFQKQQIIKDLEKKIVFITGPRQVGKTWLAKDIGKKFVNTVYLSYDRFEDREILKKEAWLETTELLILDELHKMPDWKNYLKGVFDTKSEKLKILVTGSARLEIFRQTGDSLAGRFFEHHLLPFSLAELRKINHKESNLIDKLIERGGFPEPFLAENNIEAARWRNQYVDGLVRNDIIDFTNIQDFKAIQTVFELLRRNVGSPLSFNSIARDVQISPVTAAKYIKIFESLYIIFRVPPYSRNIARSILKEPKIYFFDNGMVEGNEGVKFENFAAVSLFKHIFARNDLLGEKNELKYLRTKDGKEVDFALIDSKNAITELVEVKKRDHKISKNLKYFSDKYNLPGVQAVKDLNNEKQIGNIRTIKMEKYLSGLYL